MNESNIPQDLKVHLFNVGQGDHVMLELPNGELGLIDFFFTGETEPPALGYLKYLKSRAEKPVISFISVTHPDNDHIRGIDMILDWITDNDIEVKNFWSFPGLPTEVLIQLYNEAFQQVLKEVAEFDELEKIAANKNSIMHQLWTMNEFIERRGRRKKLKLHTDYVEGIKQLDGTIGGEVRVVALAPLSGDVRKFNIASVQDAVEHQNERMLRLLKEDKTILHQLKDKLKPRKTRAQKNMVSSVLRMQFRKHSLIFGGDTGAKVWQQALQEFSRTGNDQLFDGCRGNFVKISHHGSKNSSYEDLWPAILVKRKQSYVGISAGRGYTHPSRETIKHIDLANKGGRHAAKVLSTNACHKCLEGFGLRNEEVKWFEGNRIDWPAKVSEGFNRDRSRTYKKAEKSRRPKVPSFLGFTFVFSHRSTNVRVTKIMRTGTQAQKHCIYGGTHSKIFPGCA